MNFKKNFLLVGIIDPKIEKIDFYRQRKHIILFPGDWNILEGR